MDFKMRKVRRRVRGRQGLVWHPQTSYTNAYWSCFKLPLRLLGCRGEIYFSLFFFFLVVKTKTTCCTYNIQCCLLKLLSFLIVYKPISSSLFFLLHSSLLINCSLCNIDCNENTWQNCSKPQIMNPSSCTFQSRSILFKLCALCSFFLQLE